MWKSDRLGKEVQAYKVGMNLNVLAKKVQAYKVGINLKVLGSLTEGCIVGYLDSTNIIPE